MSLATRGCASRTLAACLVLLAVLSGCSPKASSVQDPATGKLQIATAGLGSADVTRVAISITGPSIPAWRSPITHDLVLTNGSWEGVLDGIPSGSDLVVEGSAFDTNGVLRYAGEASGVVVTPGKTTVIILVLQQATKPDPAKGNTPPAIDYIMVSASAVEPGGAIQLAAKVHDLEGEKITLTWVNSFSRYTGTTGSFDDLHAASTVWHAPKVQDFEYLCLVASDPSGSSSVCFYVEVRDAPGSVTLYAALNNWPEVKSINLSTGLVSVGQAAFVTMQASDADLDPLAFEWSASCAGSWFYGAGPTARSWNYFVPAEKGLCKLIVDVKDGRGGANYGVILLEVADPPLDVPPIVSTSFSSLPGADPTVLVTLEVSAYDPANGALEFSWKADDGILAGETVSYEGTYAGGFYLYKSVIGWSARTCAAPASTATVTVANSSGISSYTFTLPCVLNPFVNPGFETGDFTGWTVAGVTAIDGGHTGKFGAKAGSASPGTASSLSQTITVPTGASTLSFWFYDACTDPNYDWVIASLTDNDTSVSALLLQRCDTTPYSWKEKVVPIAGLWGHSVTLTILNQEYPDTVLPTYTLVDDVLVQ
jgi:hypothetical protein